jgi:hypothetical protein
MKIKSKTRVPDDGDRRVIKRFLWFPMIINDKFIWLEKVLLYQEFYVDRYNILQGWSTKDVRHRCLCYMCNCKNYAMSETDSYCAECYNGEHYGE